MARRRRKGRTAAQTAGVITASIFAIATLVVTALFISGTLTLEMLGIDGGDAGYRNITVVDAQLVCEEEARKEFASRLKSITVDSHSSRFDEKANRYRMYFNIDMYPKRRNDKQIVVNHFLNCFVHGSRGSITHFESVEDREDSPKPIRETEGHIFGF